MLNYSYTWSVVPGRKWASVRRSRSLKIPYQREAGAAGNLRSNSSFQDVVGAEPAAEPVSSLRSLQVGSKPLGATESQQN